jgi:hypothetical protein
MKSQIQFLSSFHVVTPTEICLDKMLHGSAGEVAVVYGVHLEKHTVI